MSFREGDELQQHRIIGIRHALKSFKKDSLIDDETMYPEDAVEDVKDELLRTAKKWYRIGARRGAIEMIEAILDRRFELRELKKGSLEIVAKTKYISWERRLTVRTGDSKKRLPKKKYRLTIKDLEFE